MKILLFSDTHLGVEFDQKKFDFLVRIISDCDQVIIVGDFWEGYLISFSEFVESRWSELFPLLKSKGAVYIFGNHDLKKHSDERVFLFSDLQTNRYVLEIDEQKIVIEHGHMLSPAVDYRYKLVGSRYLKLLTKKWYLLERAILRVFKKKFLKTYQGANNRMKSFIRQKNFPGTFLICGHSHLAEIDLKNNFISTGMIRRGYGQYLIIEDGKFDLKDERY